MALTFEYVNNDPIAIAATTNEGGEMVEAHYHFCYNTAIQSDPGEARSYKQAMQSEEREWWSKAVIAEINNFLKRKAWKFVKKDTVKQKGRRPIPTKHVFKKKTELDAQTGKEYTQYKDRIVTLGFMQIPCVDYTESFSPVATDTALSILFGIVLYNQHKKWVCHSYDVEAAFLEPSMRDLEMFIELPEGLVEEGFLPKEEAKETLQPTHEFNVRQRRCRPKMDTGENRVLNKQGDRNDSKQVRSLCIL